MHIKCANVVNDSTFRVEIYPVTLVYTKLGLKHLERLRSVNLDECMFEGRAL